MNTGIKCVILLMICALLLGVSFYAVGKNESVSSDTAEEEVRYEEAIKVAKDLGVEDVSYDGYDRYTMTSLFSSEDYDKEENYGKVIETSLIDVLNYAKYDSGSPRDEIYFKGYIKEIGKEKRGLYEDVYLVIGDDENDSLNDIKVVGAIYDEEKYHIGDYLWAKGELCYSYDSNNCYEDVWLYVEYSKNIVIENNNDYSDEQDFKTSGQIKEYIGKTINRPVFKTKGVLYLVNRQYKLYPSYDSFKYFPGDHIIVRNSFYDGSDDVLYQYLGKEITIQGVVGYDYYDAEAYLYGGKLME